MEAIFDIKDFSRHIFWDLNPEILDLRANKRIVIQRVLDYGLVKDWQIALKIYGIAEIAKTAITIRDLDKKSATFIALLSKTPIEKFACYSLKQSMPKQSTF